MKATVKSKPYRLLHFTPLRYPGGKGKLAAYIKAVIKSNGLLDGEYVEPYAGGAAVALELLFHEYVSRIHINDLSRPIFAFWQSVLQHPEHLCKLIKDTPLNMRAWDKQKKIFTNANGHDDIALGFATFFLNRTNRSGILNGGAIGGRDQQGHWKIDARFNRNELIGRIGAIAKMKNRIRLTSMDALDFLEGGVATWPQKTLIYLDPPYYAKGRDLYYDYYQHDDHVRVERYVAERMSTKNWIVSYDNVPTIRSLYKTYQQTVYRIGYSARESRQGSEAMFFSDTLKMPPLEGPLSLIRRVPNANAASKTLVQVEQNRQPSKAKKEQVIRRRILQ
jgi:DNA adenine methylase